MRLFLFIDKSKPKKNFVLHLTVPTKGKKLAEDGRELLTKKQNQKKKKGVALMMSTTEGDTDKEKEGSE